MMDRDKLGVGFASGTLGVFAPKKTVIVDMVMVQLLSIIVTLGIILLVGSDSISSTVMAYLVAGLFGAFFMLGTIYSRISEM
tara:strand:+ start:4228 stop:4473 length:246 start_codon:yes stop_codon:yes gene_type:complete